MSTPRADIFKFGEGGLWSDIVDGGDLDASCVRVDEEGQPRAIPTADLGDWGVEKFSVRIVCQLSKQASQAKGLLARYHVLVFPRTKQEALQEGPHAKLGCLPGLKLCEGEMALGPPPTKTWKCPLVPLTLPGTDYERQPVAPAAERLCTAIGAIMAKVTAPEICKTAATLAAKWEKLCRNPNDAVLKSPQMNWPAQERLHETQGKWIVKDFKQ
jgi:hypothetical protein